MGLVRIWNGKNINIEEDKCFFCHKFPAISQSIVVSSCAKKFVGGEILTTYFNKNYEEKGRNSIGCKPSSYGSGAALS